MQAATEKLASAPRPDKPFNVTEDTRKQLASVEITKKAKSKETPKTANPAKSPKAASPPKAAEGCCKEEPKDDATLGMQKNRLNFH